MEKVSSMYAFQMLDAEEKLLNGIRPSKERYDCTAYVSGEDRGLDVFANKKGMLFLSIRENRDYRNPSKPHYYLTGQGLNFTGLLPTSHKNIFVGYPNNNEKLSNGELNPVYGFKGDLYIIHLIDYGKGFRLYVFKDCKNRGREVIVDFLAGAYLSQIQGLICESQPYYAYKGLLAKKGV